MTSDPAQTASTAGACPVTGNGGSACPVPRGPKGLPVIGDAPAYFRDPLSYTLRGQARSGPMVRVNLAIPFIQVTEPDAVERVLRTNPDNYTRGTLYRGFVPYMGRGLLTLDDPQWRAHRRVVQPAFTPQRLRADAAEAVGATDVVLDRWATAARDGGLVNLVPDMMDISARVVGRAVIDRDLSEEGLGYSEAAAIASKVMYTKTIKGLSELLPGFLPTRYVRERRWSHRVLNGIVRDLVRARGRQGDTGTDAAGLLLASDLPDQEVADTLRTLFLAGTDTTGQALIWTLYELARHPAARRDVEDEVDAVLNGRTPTVADLERLTVTAAAIDEALRLHPPVWQFPRDATGPDTLAGRHVPAGSTVLLSSYGTHRSPEHWEDPEAYDPSRFRDASAATRHRYAFFPFGGGRRMCIGKGLALATLVTTIAMVTQRYRLRLSGTHEVRSGSYITLFPRDAVWVGLRART